MIRTLDDLDAAGKRVLVRVDLNVPITDGAVSDATRITRVRADARRADRSRGARRRRLAPRPAQGRARRSAVGRAARRAFVTGARWPPGRLSHDDCIGAAAEAAVAGLGDGDVALLENLRFHTGEEANDPDFAAALARHGDVYVDDAFSAAHRAHASNVGVAGLLPAYAGRLMQEELEALDAALENPKRPVAAIVGGAKVSTKLAVLSHLVERVDMLIIGGAMANTFLHALGVSVGRSLCEPDMADTARDIVARAKRSGCDVVLPTDAVTATRLRGRRAKHHVFDQGRRRRRHDPRSRPGHRRPISCAASARSQRLSGTARSAPSNWPVSTRRPTPSRGRSPGLPKSVAWSASRAAATPSRR